MNDKFFDRKEANDVVERILEIFHKRNSTNIENHIVKITKTSHFIDRFYERCSPLDSRLLYNCIEKNYCVLLYFRHLEISLPERGRIEYKNLRLCFDPCQDDSNSLRMRTIYKVEN
jgi:hypothetical protein